MAEKNLAAFLRDDVQSVSVQFWSDGWEEGQKMQELRGKEYTYLHTIPDLKLGDHLIVLVSGAPKVVCVTRLHDGLEVEPNSNIEFKYVITRIDYTEYNKLQEQNKALKEMVAKSYSGMVRNQFRDQILGNLPIEARQQLLSNLNKSLNQQGEVK